VRPEVETAENVPVAVVAVPPGVMVNVCVPLVIPIEVLVSTGFAKVPTALAPASPLDRTRVFEPTVSEIVVFAAGVPEAVPMMLPAVPPEEIVRVFEPFCTVMGLLVESGALENVPVWVAATGELAVRVTLSTVMVEIELLPLALLVPTVPVPPAGTAPMSMLQSRFIFAFPELPGLGPCTCGKESCNRPPAAC